jgi:hypothetical protein
MTYSTPLESSMLSKAEFNDETNVLSVTFTNGDIWDYNGASPTLYQNLTGAASPGSFFHANIRKVLQGVKR